MFSVIFSQAKQRKIFRFKFQKKEFLPFRDLRINSWFTWGLSSFAVYIIIVKIRKLTDGKIAMKMKTKICQDVSAISIQSTETLFPPSRVLPLTAAPKRFPFPFSWLLFSSQCGFYYYYFNEMVLKVRILRSLEHHGSFMAEFLG